MTPFAPDLVDRLWMRLLRLRYRETPPPPALPADSRRILVFAPLGLGALVCATPALRVLRARFPHAALDLLAPHGLGTLYEGTDLYREAIEWGLSRRADLPRTLAKIRDRVRERGYDLAVDFAGRREAARLLAAAAGIPATIRWAAPGEAVGPFRRPFSRGEHALRLFVSLVADPVPDGADLSPIPPRLRTSEIEGARETLRAWGIEDTERLVGIQMNAGPLAPRRAWPEAKFVLLAQELEEKGWKTLFFGASEEEGFVTRHVKHMRTLPINLAGRTSLRQLAALLSHLRFLIANDSGPVHLAAALGVPTVSIYGPESPERFGPPESEIHEVIWPHPPCGPCVSVFSDPPAPCLHGRRCLQTLSIDRVRAGVEALLERLPSSRAAGEGT